MTAYQAQFNTINQAQQPTVRAETNTFSYGIQQLQSQSQSSYPLTQDSNTILTPYVQPSQGFVSSFASQPSQAFAPSFASQPSQAFAPSFPNQSFVQPNNLVMNSNFQGIYDI
jgi:hypothetical protein